LDARFPASWPSFGRTRVSSSSTGLVFVQPAPKDSPVADNRLVYLGDDPSGRPLEVIGVEDGISRFRWPTRQGDSRHGIASQIPHSIRGGKKMAKVKRTKAGTELTPVIEDVMADGAEGGYDLSTAQKEANRTSFVGTRGISASRSSSRTRAGRGPPQTCSRGTQKSECSSQGRSPPLSCVVTMTIVLATQDFDRPQLGRIRAGVGRELALVGISLVIVISFVTVPSSGASMPTTTASTASTASTTELGVNSGRPSLPGFSITSSSRRRPTSFQRS